jgi:hypothetical protein
MTILLPPPKCVQKAVDATTTLTPGDGINWVYLKNRVVCIAGKPAPTEKQSYTGFRFGFRF